MGTNRADFRRGFSHHDMATVAAFPNLNATLFEDFLYLNVVQQSPVSFLVVLLNSCYATEFLSQLRETFFFSGLGKALIHVRPFIVLAVSGGSQILGCGADAPQFLEPELGVFLLVVGSFKEERRDLLKALFFCFGSKISVFVSGLRLTCKGCFQVFSVWVPA